MSNSIRIVLLVEDNPGDARLLREMFNEQGSPDTELIHPTRVGWRRYGAHASPRPMLPSWC